jgi:hypothetical protein
MQQWGVSYCKTHSLIINMLMVCLLLTLCNAHGLESKSINFVLAFLQTNLDVDIWMELPMGIVIDTKWDNSWACILKLKKSVYGLKKASLNWFEKLKQGLVDCGFTPSEINPYLYLKENTALLAYIRLHHHQPITCEYRLPSHIHAEWPREF